jgi:hypothetical protein
MKNERTNLICNCCMMIDTIFIIYFRCRITQFNFDIQKSPFSDRNRLMCLRISS